MKPVFHSKINNINELRLTRVFLLVGLFLLMSMNGWAQPTATISGTTTVCQGSTPFPDITFTGADGKHYTFTYTINGVSQTVSTTGNNSSVKKSVPSGTAGTFTYTLVSVRDVSGSQAVNNEN